MSELISAAEAAASLHVNRTQLDNWRSRNFGPPYFKIGGSVMYDRAELMKWFRARRVEPSSNSPGYKPPAASRRKASRSRNSRSRIGAASHCRNPITSKKAKAPI